jgi:FkbM family methyltransferase
MGDEDEKSETKEGGLDRRSVLVGAFGGVLGGGGAGFFAGDMGRRADVHAAELALARAQAAASAAASAKPSRPNPRSDPRSTPSFAQQGEDIILTAMVRDVAEVTKPTYLDIGAFDPVVSNNTFLMYLLGGHGVLVEPNPAFAERLRKERPKDVVLEIGIGVTAAPEADYYVLSGDGQLNTFSKDQAERVVDAGSKIEKVLKRKMVPINDVLAEQFPKGAPDVMSLDVEGLDKAILESMDFERWRPIVICVETSEFKTGRVEKEIVELLVKKGYEPRGGTFVNTIFVDGRRLTKKK